MNVFCNTWKAFAHKSFSYVKVYKFLDFDGRFQQQELNLLSLAGPKDHTKTLMETVAMVLNQAG